MAKCVLLYRCVLGKTGTRVDEAFQVQLWDAPTTQVQENNKNKSIVCPSICQLTMWMKSTAVAVYKSHCSLSRMILSMRRISAVEKLHPLCTTRSWTEPITSSSSLILAAKTNEVKAMHFRYLGWALTVDSSRLRTQTPSANVSGQKWNSRFISPSQKIISWYWDEETSAPWMHPFLKTGTFQRRASLSRAASSRTTSRRLSAAPGLFIATTAQAGLHPGHTPLFDYKRRISPRRQVHLYGFSISPYSLKATNKQTVGCCLRNLSRGRNTCFLVNIWKAASLYKNWK